MFDPKSSISLSVPIFRFEDTIFWLCFSRLELSYLNLVSRASILVKMLAYYKFLSWEKWFFKIDNSLLEVFLLAGLLIF